MENRQGSDGDGDADASLLSARPRGVEFTEKQQPVSLGPQRNVGEETRSKITQKDFYGGGGVIGTVTRVCYGQYRGKRACIVAFNFLFHWKRFEDRLTHAEIEVSFSSYLRKSDKGKRPAAEPVVRNVSPGKIHGISNANGQRWSCTTERQCAVSLASQAAPTGAPHIDRAAFNDSHRLEISGQRWSDSRKRDFYKACLVLDEIGSPTIGITEEANVAVLVECDGDFQADVAVEVQVPWLKKLKGFPWSADEPLLFVHHGIDTPVGNAIRIFDFGELSDKDWKEILLGNDVVNVSLSMENVATDKVLSNTPILKDYRLYRVQGIPAQYEPSTLRKFLQDVVNDDPGNLEIELRALTLDPRSNAEKMAVIGSLNLHERLSSGQRWSYSLPAPEQVAALSRKQNVVVDTVFSDITLLAVPEGDPDFDVIALSGLGAHSFGSFKDRGGTYMWLADDLVFDFPKSRIMTYGYETALLNSQSFQALEHLATTFASSLRTMRRDLLNSKKSRPIIFIAHSLGGIVLKQALIQMVDGDALDQANARSTQGIMLFGVPSLGMNITPLLGKVTGQPNEPFLHNLRPDSDRLRRLNRDFREKFTYKSCKIMSLYETELSPTAKKGPDGWTMEGEPAVIVTQDSATGGSRSWESGPKFEHPLKKNHSCLVKYYPRDPCYLQVKDILTGLMEDSKNVAGNAAELTGLSDDPVEANPEYDLGLQLEDAPEIDSSSFVGRNEEIRYMAEVFLGQRNRADQKSLIISGLGGVGKSQLALHFAKQHQQGFSSVFWLKAHSEGILRQSLVRIGRRLSQILQNVDFSVQHSQEEKLIEDARGWFSRPDNNRWLLIFDNHDDPEIPGKQSTTAYNVKRYLPHRSQGSIIITTRRPRLSFGAVLALGKLEQLQESLDILSNRSGRENTANDPAATSLALRLDGLPLALATAGDYLRQTPESFAEYLRNYEDSWNDLEETAEGLPDYEGRTLYSTWNVSLAKISAQSPDTAMILKFMAYLGNQDIWFELFQHAAHDAPPWMQNLASSRIKFGAEMRKLQDYSLVEVRRASSSYGLHTCVHDWTLDHLNDELDGRMYALALRCVATQAKTVYDQNYWSIDLRLEGHAMRLAQGRFRSLLEAGLTGYILNMAHWAGYLLLRRSRLAEAESFCTWTVTGMERMFGTSHQSTLDTVSTLADISRQRGKLLQAQELYQRALLGKEAIHGENHQSTLNTINNLGNLFLAQGKLDDAEKLYDRALAGYTKICGSEHVSTINTLCNLAIIYRYKGKLELSAQTFEQALQLREKTLGSNNPSNLNLLNNLATLYRAQGKFAESEEMFTRVYARSKETFGEEHKATLEAASNLGLIYSDLGRYAESERFLLNTLSISESALGKNHPAVMDTLNNLAGLYTYQGKLVEAQDVHERVLETREATLGPDHIMTLSTVKNLSVILRQRGDLEKSKEMCQRALSGYEAQLGSRHQSTLHAMLDFATLYKAQGELGKAEEMCLRALRGFEAALGNEHLLTVSTANRLGEIYYAEGKVTEALEIYQRALQDGKGRLKSDHPLIKSIEANIKDLPGSTV